MRSAGARQSEYEEGGEHQLRLDGANLGTVTVLGDTRAIRPDHGQSTTAGIDGSDSTAEVSRERLSRAQHCAVVARSGQRGHGERWAAFAGADAPTRRAAGACGGQSGARAQRGCAWRRASAALDHI